MLFSGPPTLLDTTTFRNAAAQPELVTRQASRRSQTGTLPPLPATFCLLLLFLPSSRSEARL